MADVHRFDTELVSTVIGNLKHSKAPDINGLCAECRALILLSSVNFASANEAV